MVMSFWEDVRELRELTKLKMQQGHGRKAMDEAIKEQLRIGAVTSVDAQTAASLKKQGLAGLMDVLKDVPQGQQIRMTAEEYRKMMGGK
jgi:hypothetical protein